VFEVKNFFERDQLIMQRTISRMRTRKGFTLVELAVVIVIIGVLAAFGVPKFLNSVEKSKATEAFNFLSSIQGAEERYIAQYGVYSGTIVGDGSVANPGLDVVMPTMKYFTQPTTVSTTLATGGAPSWSLMLTRIAATSSYGGYTVNWTDQGFDQSSTSTITTTPQICPVAVVAPTS
jgi:prepilin-type N-terminal cleavage/methylation domain-containing protein